jgi:Transposase DDE domain
MNSVAPVPASVPAAWRPLAALSLESLARACGLVRRRPRKIQPLAFLQTSCLLALQPNVSLSGWAGLWSVFHGQTLSKQAVAKRCSAAAVSFLQSVLKALLAKLGSPTLPPPQALAHFPRVLIQDSTCLSLPQKLAAQFPGSYSHSHGRSATLKIQALYEVFSQSCLELAVGSFSQNDQKASPSILSFARKGDLVLRDLGYAVLEVFAELAQKGIYFLSRWQPHTALLDPRTGLALDLLRHLRAQGQWDGTVWLGKDKRLPVRLVAVPVPEAVAAERRRKLRANRDRRLRPSAKRLALLGWDIFITNVPASLWPPALVPVVYGLRWRIEILFKAWKSHFRLEAHTGGSAPQVQVLVYGRLLWICLFQVSFLNGSARTATLSVIKLAGWSQNFLLPWLLAAHRPPRTANPLTLIAYYCRYERRRKRKNFYQKLSALG